MNLSEKRITEDIVKAYIKYGKLGKRCEDFFLKRKHDKTWQSEHTVPAHGVLCVI